MLKITRFEEDGTVIFALSGRINEAQVSELQRLLEAEPQGQTIVFDLAEVRLVDREAVKLLAASEGRGIRLKNCPSYVRKWIETGSNISHES